MVTRFDLKRRRIGLRLERVLERTKTAGDLPAVGERHYGEIVKIVPELGGSKGGYVLIKLPNHEAPALLHASGMTPALRRDLNNNQIDVGEILMVEVKAVDPSRNRISLQEVPEPGDESAEPEVGSAGDVQLSAAYPA